MFVNRYMSGRALSVRHIGDHNPRRRNAMRYLLQIYMPEDESVWERLSEDEKGALSAEYFALMQDPGVTGGAQLAPTATATTVRVNDGRTLSTDGPFPETKEALGGYYLIDVEDLDA